MIAAERARQSFFDGDEAKFPLVRVTQTLKKCSNSTMSVMSNVEQSLFFTSFT